MRPDLPVSGWYDRPSDTVDSRGRERLCSVLHATEEHDLLALQASLHMRPVLRCNQALRRGGKQSHEEQMPNVQVDSDRVHSPGC